MAFSYSVFSGRSSISLRTESSVDPEPQRCHFKSLEESTKGVEMVKRASKG